MLLKKISLNYLCMNKFLILIIFIFITSVESFAQTDGTQTVYMIKEKDSLESVTRNLLPRYKIKYGNNIEDFKKDLIEWNPQISNWQEIPLYSNIYIEFPYPAYISYPYAPKLSQGINYNVLNSDAETPIGNRKFTLFTMFTASIGNFEEQVKTTEGSIKSTQNSPLTLGLGTTIFLDQRNRMITSSVYWSSLRASKLGGDDNSSKKVETKAEIGLNFYYQQLTPWKGISVYGGADYEQFSTFNTLNFAVGDELELNQNKLIFATIGLGKTFFFNDNKLLFKSSLSQSLSSKTTSDNPNDLFKGQRLLLYASFKGESQFTYHLIYKRHMLEGPTKLTINRIGVGIGFVIF